MFIPNKVMVDTLLGPTTYIFINTPLETLVFGADRFGVPFRREDRMRSYLIQEGRWFRTLVAGSRCQHPGAQYLPLNPYILCVFMCTLKNLKKKNYIITKNVCR